MPLFCKKALYLTNQGVCQEIYVSNLQNENLCRTIHIDKSSRDDIVLTNELIIPLVT